LQILIVGASLMALIQTFSMDSPHLLIWTPYAANTLYIGIRNKQQIYYNLQTKVPFN